VLIQIGAVSMTRFGQLRSTRFMGAKALYLVAGFCCMALLREVASMGRILRKRRRQVLAFQALLDAELGIIFQ
jgi:hypothetical protein